MWKKIVVCSCLCLYSLHSSAQHLKPKGTLGIEYTEASDSLMRSLRGLETRGIVVKSIKPNSTAEQMGLLPNDVLVAINNVDSLYLYDFVTLSNQLQENEPISITYLRDRRKARVVGTVTAKPKEIATVGEILYDEVPFGRDYLRSIVQKPRGEGKFPAVFYMQDYDCNSIDFATDSSNTTKKLIEGWVKAGYAVFRIEKPGIGESAGIKNCNSLGYLEELNAFENGFRTLKKLRYIDSTKVFLFGHSLGGMAAPLVAAQATYKPRGIITYGTVVKPWFEYMIDVFREQPTLLKESQQSIDVNTRMMTPLLFDWLVNGNSTSGLLQNPDFEAIMTSKENPLQYQKGTFFGRSAKYFSELNSQTLASAWAKAGVPVLAIHGEMDIQAINAEAAQNIATIVNEVKPNKGVFKVLKGTDQHFVKIPSLAEGQKLSKSGNLLTRYTARNFNSEIIEMTVNWMKFN
jgi:uncharacterized protein